MLRRSRVGVLLVVGLLAVGCARKMTPPAPDRFAPGLAVIQTIDRGRLELVFDEPLDGRKVTRDSIIVTDADGRQLWLWGAVPGRDRARVELWTARQEQKVYQVVGVVWDAAGNPGRFRGRFVGSSKLDTIPPRVTRLDPAPATFGLGRASIMLEFSEPLDTSALLDYQFVPAAYDTLYQPRWEEGWRRLGFSYRDSLEPGRVYYFVLQPRTRDLEGNRLPAAVGTYFTPDTAPNWTQVRGRAVWQRGPLGTGTVFFNDGATRGLAVVQTDGSFSTRVPPGSYRVMVAADTSGDGMVDLVGERRLFSTVNESLTIFLGPESIPRPFDGYRR